MGATHFAGTTKAGSSLCVPRVTISELSVRKLNKPRTESHSQHKTELEYRYCAYINISQPFLNPIPLHLDFPFAVPLGVAYHLGQVSEPHAIFLPGCLSKVLCLGL